MATLSFGSHSVFTGGTFTQVNHNIQERQQTPYDRLQSAASPAAFHNSAERFDSPRCHPNTRLVVMDELIDWVIRRGDAGHMRLVWLSGPAGAGKSAIAQSLSELCSAQNFLLATFFFNRSDSSRNNPKRLIATISYQIYGMVPPRYQYLILEVIKNDPLVFDRSIEAQFKALIMDPLRDLFEVDYFNNYDAPRLIVLDGLDECLTSAAQVNILTTVQTILRQSNTPFIFLIASRPEHAIQMFFKSSCLGFSIHQLNLDDSYLPHRDIELFLREKIQETCATHPLKNSIPQAWPSRDAIEDLVQKSSGQFIYASVVVKYVTSSRHYPPHRLDVVRQLLPLKRDLPFAELDALYSHIFSCLEDIPLALRILRIILLFQDAYTDLFMEDIEQLCKLDQGECFGALCDLQSVLQVEPVAEQSVRLLHKSLPDYLQEPSRSRQYFIDTTPRTVIPIVVQAFRLISDPKLDYNPRCTSFFGDHLGLLVSNIPLCHSDLMSFSLIDCLKTFNKTDSEFDKSQRRIMLLWIAFCFFEKLCTLEGTDYEYVYHHHIHQFPELASEHLKSLRPSTVPLEDLDSTWIFPMIIIFSLLGDSDIHISPKVFEILQQLPFNKPSQFPLLDAPAHMIGFDNLCCSAARRCLNSLMHDSNLQSAEFAFEFLPLILPIAKLSPDLNKSCLPGRPFAYALTGDHGLSTLAQSAYTAMQEYRERYEVEDFSDTDSN